MSSFDQIAPFYDFLKKIVFQSTLDRAANIFIADVPANAHVLIIGGGTGEMLKYFQANQTVTYIEQSTKMLAMAKKRAPQAKVHYICADILRFQLPSNFDCIITPFVLDCFDKVQLYSLVGRLTASLKAGGLWLHTDFYPHNRLQKSFVQVMYFFFRKTAGLRLSEIPDFTQLFSNEKYIIKKNVRFKRGLIQSIYYKKIA